MHKTAHSPRTQKERNQPDDQHWRIFEGDDTLAMRTAAPVAPGADVRNGRGSRPLLATLPWKRKVSQMNVSSLCPKGDLNPHALYGH